MTDPAQNTGGKRAVIFDLDGTLLDTLLDLALSMNAALASCGFRPHPTEAYRRFTGDGVRTLARRALPETQRDNATVERVVSFMREEYRQQWPKHSHPYDGVPALLDRLAERGYRAAVLSNKPQDFTREMVARLLPGRVLDPVLGAEADFPSKPDPSAALAMAKAWGIEEKSILFVGDSGTDMETALAAYMTPIGVAWGFRPAAELEEAGAAHILTRPQELLDLLA